MTHKDKKYSNPEETDEFLDELASEEQKQGGETDDNLSDNSEETQSESEQLQQKYDDLNDSYLRLHAEFDNYRKRTIKEKADIIRSGGERVLSDIIPLVDDFERALQTLHEAEEQDAMLEGIDLIYQKFVSFLHQHGVKEIESIGQSFDPERFEAITTIPVADEAQKGKIVDCIQKGYTLNDKVIRFPKVIVGE